MELLPLPAFHHTLMGIVVLSFVSILLAFLYRFRPKKRKIPKDIYMLSKALREFEDIDEVRKLLQELEPYKYVPNPPPMPKKLLIRAKKIYSKYANKKYQQIGRFYAIIRKKRRSQK